MTTMLNCPTCKVELAWSKENVYRPFCSKRCQMIDFGEWANETYTIPAKPDAASFEQLDEEQLAEIARRMSAESDKLSD